MPTVPYNTMQWDSEQGDLNPGTGAVTVLQYQIMADNNFSERYTLHSSVHHQQGSYRHQQGSHRQQGAYRHQQGRTATSRGRTDKKEDITRSRMR